MRPGRLCPAGGGWALKLRSDGVLAPAMPDDPAVVRDIRRAIVALCAKFHDWFRRHDPDTIHPMSFAMRLLSEAGPSLLSGAWHRLAMIDAEGREWGQPYYAEHPSKAKQFAWVRHGKTWRRPKGK